MHPFVEKLLEGEKVEFKKLDEVATLYGGLTGKNKYDFENGNAKYVTYKNIFNDLEVNPNKFEFVKIENNEKQNKIKYGDILFTGSSESLDEVGFCAAVTQHFNEDIYLNSFSFGVRFNEEILIPDFSKFLFTTELMRKQIKKTAKGVTRYNISKEKFKKIIIPIPPLKTQQKIVDILDKFCKLKNALKNERALRLKQYAYYRDKLLSFGEGVEVKTLGEVAKLKHGKDWKHLEKGDIPVYGSGGIMAYVNQSTFNKESILIPRKGSINNIFYVDKPFWNVDTIYYTEIDTNIIYPKYFYYVMTTFDLMSLNLSTARPSLAQAMLNPLKIPIPPLEKQKEIAEILDKFDKLTNDIAEGLPREIELREKQYCYYRDLLLTFD